jgi:hypothetical protein
MFNHVTKKPYSTRRAQLLAIALRLAPVLAGPAIIQTHPLYLLVVLGVPYFILKGWISWPVLERQENIQHHINNVQKPW